MNQVLCRIAFRNIFRQKRRTLLTLLTITIGVWSCLSLATLARGIGNQMAGDTIKTFLGSIQVHRKGYLDDPVIHKNFDWPHRALSAFLLEEEKIVAWTTRLRVPGVVLSERESTGVTVLGVEPKKELELTFLRETLIEGRYLESVQDAGVIIGENLAKKLKVSLGKKIVLMSENKDGVVRDRGFRIVGVFKAEVESTENRFILVGKETLQKMLSVPGEINEISILTPERADIPSLLQKLRKDIDDLEILSWDEIQPMIGSMLKIQDGFLLLWYGIVIIAVVFGLTNAIFMAIMERTKEFGILLALGLRPSGIIRLILYENAILLLTGVIIGNVLTGASTYLLRDGIDLTAFAKGVEAFGAASIVYPTPLFHDWLLASVLVVFLGLVGALYPAYRASRFEPVEAIHTE